VKENEAGISDFGETKKEEMRKGTKKTSYGSGERLDLYQSRGINGGVEC